MNSSTLKKVSFLKMFFILTPFQITVAFMIGHLAVNLSLVRSIHEELPSYIPENSRLRKQMTPAFSISISDCPKGPSNAVLTCVVAIVGRRANLRQSERQVENLVLLLPYSNPRRLTFLHLSSHPDSRFTPNALPEKARLIAWLLAIA